MAHICQESALRSTRFLSRVFGFEKLFLCLLSLSDFPFELFGSGMQLIIGIQQGGIALLNLGEHVVEAVHQPADFIAICVLRTYFIVLVSGDDPYGVFELQNWARNHSLQLRGKQQGKQARGEDEDEKYKSVAFGAARPL